MARTINFVRERQKTLSRQEQDDKQILKYVTWGLFGLGVIILSIVGARLFFLYQIQSLQDQQESVKQEIAQLEGVEQEYTIFANKLKILTELFGKRKEKQEALAYFSSLFGPDVIISQLSYTAGDEILTFVLDSKNIFVLEEVFDTMSSQDVKTRYPMLSKDSLRRSQDASYGMQVTLVFGDQPAEEPDATEDPADGETDLIEEEL